MQARVNRFLIVDSDKPVQVPVLADLGGIVDASVHGNVDAWGKGLHRSKSETDIENSVIVTEPGRKQGTGQHNGLVRDSGEGNAGVGHRVRAVRDKDHAVTGFLDDLADEITYYSHDLDDGLDSGLLSETQLRRHVELWRYAARRVQRDFGVPSEECRRYFIIRCIIDEQVHDVVNRTEKRIRSSRVASADDVRQKRRALVQYSPDLKKQNAELRAYLYHNLYYNPEVYDPNRRAVSMLEALFEYYVKSPGQMGDLARKRIRKDGVHRAVCDYLAGMTDRYAISEHERLLC